jgi:hypothetical protein
MVDETKDGPFLLEADQGDRIVGTIGREEVAEVVVQALANPEVREVTRPIGWFGWLFWVHSSTVCILILMPHTCRTGPVPKALSFSVSFAARLAASARYLYCRMPQPWQYPASTKR